MKRALPIVLDVLHALALALWLGGVALFWLLTSSGLAQGHGGVPTEPANALLGAAWGSLGLWAERCGLVMVGVQFVLRRRFQRNRSRFIGDGVRQLLTFSALLVTEYAHRSLQYRSILQTHTVPGGSFVAADSTLMSLCAIQAALLIAVIALTAWLHQPAAASIVVPVSNAATPTMPSAPTRPTRASGKRRAAK